MRRRDFQGRAIGAEVSERVVVVFMIVSLILLLLDIVFGVCSRRVGRVVFDLFDGFCAAVCLRHGVKYPNSRRVDQNQKKRVQTSNTYREIYTTSHQGEVPNSHTEDPVTQARKIAQWRDSPDNVQTWAAKPAHGARDVRQSCIP